MKTLLSNYKLLILFALMAVFFPMEAQTYENSRSLREAYRIEPNAEVQVINKYGDIHLIPWEKDSVVFQIDFSVTSNKQAKVDKIFDYVDFDFKATAYYVIAQTVFEGQNTIWSEMADVAGTIFSSGTTTRIDYTVYFPSGNDVRIENKFGNIYTTDHLGKADINLSNGDLKAHRFGGPIRLKIEFGNATIDEIVSGNVLLGYSEFNLEKAGDLAFETRSSKVYITEAEMLKLDAKRDRYNIKSVAELTGDSFFSYLSMDKAISRINLKTTYGDVKLTGISSQFERADLTSQYTDINIYLDSDHLFEFEITRDDRSEVVSSASIITMKEEPVAGTDDSFRSFISAGKADRPKVPVTINIKSGKIYLL